jgi:uncharacterized protein (DUF433 family)
VIASQLKHNGVYGHGNQVLSAALRNRAPKMWNPFEKWQLNQLSKLSNLDQQRVETMLNTLYRQYPDLFQELVIMAVHANEITIERGAELLQMPTAEIDARVQVYRRQEAVAIQEIKLDQDSRIARLQSGGVAIWEIVRELRKLGSVDRIESSFPALTKKDIAAALRYAQLHPEEIERQIKDYEDSLSRKRIVYPHA